MTKTRIYLLILPVLFFWACRSESEERVMKGHEYFPMRIGDVRMYQIDTIVYDIFRKSIDTISHTVREEVVESYTDASQDSVFRLELSTYSSLSDEWVVFRSFERKIDGNFALEKMENNTEVKMLFPISAYKTRGSSYTWNANMFNQREALIMKFTSVFTPFNNGLRAFNDCVSIKPNKPKKGIINFTREEVYARNTGLVYRYMDSTDYLLGDTFPSGKITILRLKN